MSRSRHAALAFLLISSPSFAASAADPLPPVRFEDVAAQAGLDFTLDNAPTAEKRMIETMAGGVAVFDYDGDGLIDIFFTNGAALPSMKKQKPSQSNRLYRNLGELKFADVTEQAGLGGEGYSMGAAAADYDNDGDVDLFVAGVFHNLLYRNRGDGTFVEVARSSGINSERWSVASGWFDYDNDGLLDLMVVNYSEWSVDQDRFCGDRNRNIRVYCHPKYFTPISNQLYHNLGGGRFEEVTDSSGVGDFAGRGMSVAFNDYDGDGLIDAFVTNDNLPNFLFHNLGDGTFEEDALLAGVALREHGKPVASMGADFRDYDNDGLPDLSVTALAGETFPLFHNEGEGLFEDATYSSGMAKAANPFSGWSNGFFDFNNDGWKDLFASNSHVNDLIHLFENYVYKQANAVFLNDGNGSFRALSSEAGFTVERAHRGSGFADFDGDGRIDIVVSSLGEPAELWRNVSPAAGNWIVFRLRGTKSNRDGLGARIRISDQVNSMTSSVGYASSSLVGVHFGLGSATRVEKAEILWPSGATQTLEDIEVNRVVEVTEP